MNIKRQGSMQPLLAIQAISLDVLREKYAYGDEKRLDGARMMAAIRTRVAKALAANECDPLRWEQAFYRAMQAGFIPGGRINNAAGTDLRTATLINCFVQPVGDGEGEAQDGRPDVVTALSQASECQRRGGGVGFDFSALRPRDAQDDGDADSVHGPLACMQVFDRSCAAIEAAGARRGAQMAVLRIDHPDIVDFVNAKQSAGSLSNFNLSVGVTDAFMHALEKEVCFELVHKATPSRRAIAAGAYQRRDGLWVYRKMAAVELWDGILHNSYETAEPGVLFLDRINAENNLYYLENIEATNPCGEIPLPAFGCCCLGSIDLTACVVQPFSTAASFDFEAFKSLAAIAVRMLDNVLDINLWTLPEQRAEAFGKRRIGLGFTGLGDALIELGLRYDSTEGRSMAARIARTLRDEAYRASVALAREKGAFPALDADKYLASWFAQRLPDELRQAIRRDGIRNSHLLAVAPAGTISLAFADNCSNGMEPAFNWYYRRKKRGADNVFSEYRVEDHAYRLYAALGHNRKRLPAAFVAARRIAAHDHLLMQAAIQPYIDSSISKTVNIPHDYPFERYRHLFFDAWKAGLKGITTYRQGSVLGYVLESENGN
ncbi:MAG: adenosylcobalamin-dependent ribonucleoside-diphosphate reductase [Gammaproteobacteria bacterium]